MTVQDYSSALFDLLQSNGDSEALLDSFKAFLKKKGHEKLYAQILKDLLSKLQKNTDKNSIQVVVSREKDITNLEESISKSIATFGTTKEFSTLVDPTLIGGFKIIGHDKVIDHSYKKQLLTIYKSLTT